MTDNKILITKTRSGGNRMVRADTKDGLGNGTWINANQLDNTLIDQVREIAHEHRRPCCSSSRERDEHPAWWSIPSDVDRLVGRVLLRRPDHRARRGVGMSTHLTIDRGRIVEPHHDRPSNPVGVAVILWLVCAVVLMGVVGWAAVL